MVVVLAAAVAVLLLLLQNEFFRLLLLLLLLHLWQRKREYVSREGGQDGGETDCYRGLGLDKVGIFLTGDITYRSKKEFGTFAGLSTYK